MTSELEFSITTTRFDEHYSPSASSRSTTNFANLARGDKREQNLRNTLAMIESRFNGLGREGNPEQDRYGVELEIVSADLHFTAGDNRVEFPLIEILYVTILDRVTGARIDGIAGTTSPPTSVTTTSACSFLSTTRMRRASASSNT